MYGSEVQAAPKRPSVMELLGHPWVVAHRPAKALARQPSAPAAPETPVKQDGRRASGEEHVST